MGEYQKLTNMTLRIAASPLLPLSMPEAGENGRITLKGLSGYMVQLLSQGLGFKYTIHVPSDGNWGGRRSDGSWGGQVGLVVRNVCNVAAGPMAMNVDRVSAMLPLPAYFYADAGHMAGRRQVYSSDVFGYIYAFDEQVWMALGIALLATAVIMVLFQNNFKRAGAVRKFIDYVFLLFAMLLTKGPSRCPNNTRMLIGVWWLAVIFSTTMFTSYMQASMTVKTEMPRIESVKDFVNRPDILPIIIDGMAFDIILNTSTFPEDNQLWRRIQKLQSQWPFKRVFSQDTYEDVLDGKKVVFMEQSLYHYGVRLLYPDEPPRGQFYFGKEKRATLPTSMYVSYDEPRRVKKSLHRMSRWICESGMIDMHLNNVLLKTWKMLDLQQLSASALSLDDVFGLFALWAIGMALAATALLVECVPVAVRKLRKPKKRPALRSLTIVDE